MGGNVILAPEAETSAVVQWEPTARLRFEKEGRHHKLMQLWVDKLSGEKEWRQIIEEDGE